MVSIQQTGARLAWCVGTICLLAGPALADIDGFEVREISAIGDVSLDSRLGLTSSADQHLINIADCEAYAGGTIEVEFGVDTSNYLSYTYGVAVALPGKTCQTDSTDFAGSDDTHCKVIETAGELSSSFSVNVDLDRLTGGDCAADIESTAVLYLVIADSDAANAQKEEIYFDLDLRRPSAPELLEVIGGDGRIEVLFESRDSETEEGLSYEVYWSTESINDPPSSSVSSLSTSSTSVDIDDETIVNGLTYYVRVAASDAADNTSDMSDELSVEPVPTTDFWEAYKAAGGTDPGGFCFIATAAYGTPMAADLDLLRAFRDQILWPTALGRAFVRGYYDWGRHAALWIAERPAVKAVVRVALQPLVWIAAMTTGVGPVSTLALLVLMMGLLTLTWRQWRQRGERSVEVL